MAQKRPKMAQKRPKIAQKWPKIKKLHVSYFLYIFSEWYILILIKKKNNINNKNFRGYTILRKFSANFRKDFRHERLQIF